MGVGCRIEYGTGFDLTSHSPRCFSMAWMTSRSSMEPMICMIPRHFGQVRGSTFPDQVGDRLRSSVFGVTYTIDWRRLSWDIEKNLYYDPAWFPKLGH